jgi:hypothetical protein
MARGGKRHIGKIVYFTREELDRVTESARHAGMTAGRFLRELGLARTIRARPARASEERTYHLARLGNNANQLMKLAHVEGLRAVEGQARDLLAEIHRLLRED